MKLNANHFAAAALCLGLASVCAAQTAPAGEQTAAQTPTPAAPPAGPTALPTPSVTRPVSMIPPATLGKVAFNGIFTGLYTATSNHVPGDHTSNVTVSNGQVWAQKTDGVF